MSLFVLPENTEHPEQLFSLEVGMGETLKKGEV